MLNLLSPQYYWPGIVQDVRNYCKHCEICQFNKKSKQKKFGLMQNLPSVSEPFEILSIDTVGGLNYYNSTKRYIHIIIDHATRYIWTFASKSVTTDTYINCLKQIFQIQVPKKILSDRNAAFTSSKFKHFLRNHNVKQLLTTANRPQTNGKIERVNQTIITRLKCKLNSYQGNIAWTKLLPQVTEEYNNTPHSVTKFPPSYLMYGKLPYDSLIQNQELYPSIEEARKIAQKRSDDYHNVNKERYDIHFKPSNFKIGDLVMYEKFQYPNTRKLSPPFSGPYKILKQYSEVTYKIDKPNPLTKKKSEIVHSTRLRPFNPA
ncbi:Retrotransposable element Tf2 protein type 3, partial [Stegodyphus mimosarum]